MHTVQTETTSTVGDTKAGRGRPARRRLRWVAMVVVGLVVLGLIAVMTAVPPASPRRLVTGVAELGDRSFYQPPSPAVFAPPGTLVRSERLLSAPVGSRAWRVLYHSTDAFGLDLVVSGVVVTPTAAPPAGGRVVVGWAHPTTGAVARCAPSNGVDPFVVIEGASALLRAGYAIAAADYPGLGVAGQSSYLVGAAEAHSVLDSVRATRQLLAGETPAETSDETVLWGHSQGGQAVLFAAQEARTYSPELRLRAVAVAAPAAELAMLLDDDIGDLSGVTIGSYAFAAYESVYASRTPGLSLSTILTPAGAAATPQMSQLCLFGQLLQIHALARPLIGGYTRADPATTAPWAALLAMNTPGGAPLGVPLFVAQGLKDQLVRPDATRAYVARACRDGEHVTYGQYPDDDHGSIANTAVPAVLPFFSAALAGTPTPSTC